MNLVNFTAFVISKKLRVCLLCQQTLTFFKNLQSVALLPVHIRSQTMQWVAVKAAFSRLCIFSSVFLDKSPMFYVKYNNQLQGPHFVSNKNPSSPPSKVAYFGSNSTPSYFLWLTFSVCPFWVFTTHQKLILYGRLNLFRADVWHIKQWNMYNMDNSDFSA